MERALDPAKFPSAEALNAAVATTVERHIHDHIDQWCIFRPLWEPAAALETAPSGATRHAEA